MKICVCVGSSCHLKGSYDIVQALEKLIKENNLEEEVSLCATFCLGHCVEGVAVEVDDSLHLSLNKDNVEEFFQKEILSRVK